MHMKSIWRNVWFGDGFKALELPFRQAGSMWFILPDEGSSPEALLSSGALIGQYPPKAHDQLVLERDVTMTIPKFEVSSDLDMVDSLKRLGIRRVFTDNAEMPYTHIKNDMLKLGQARQGVRLKIDEKGCEGGAYTVLGGFVGEFNLDIPLEIELTFDRPFLFIVSGFGSLPLFMGIFDRPDPI